jgi:hypothetical protein
MNVATFSVLVSLPLLAIACNCQASPVAKTTFAWVIKVLEEMLIDSGAAPQSVRDRGRPLLQVSKEPTPAVSARISR